jgi:hypothetical protein
MLPENINMLLHHAIEVARGQESKVSYLHPVRPSEAGPPPFANLLPHPELLVRKAIKDPMDTHNIVGSTQHQPRRSQPPDKLQCTGLPSNTLGLRE